MPGKKSKNTIGLMEQVLTTWVKPITGENAPLLSKIRDAQLDLIKETSASPLHQFKLLNHAITYPILHIIILSQEPATTQIGQ